MDWIQQEFIEEHVDFSELMTELKLAFRRNTIQSPPKSSYNYTGAKEAKKNTFLFMPAWDNKNVFGTKLITATSNNPILGLPYIQGMYILFDAKNGKPLIGMDAKVMTNYRTAATSALATSYLAKKKADSILIIGNGSLAPYFIRAHATVRKYSTIYLWGLDKKPSEVIKLKLEKENIEIRIIDDFKHVSNQVDVITCITSAKSPLLKQSNLGLGQHLDLVGSFTPEMHEVSTDVISNCTIYSDNIDTTPHHAGELVKAISEGKLTLDKIEGDLMSLCKDDEFKRKNNVENTLFKSTGMALEDLVIAQLIYKKYNEQTR